MSHPAHLSRREALIAGAGMLCSLAATRSGASLRALVTEEVAPGIHIRRGVDEDASAANGDAIANIGFIVGRSAVAVIDPGGSLDDGERLRADSPGDAIADSLRGAFACPSRPYIR